VAKRKLIVHMYERFAPFTLGSYVPKEASDTSVLRSRCRLSTCSSWASSSAASPSGASGDVKFRELNPAGHSHVVCT